MENPITDTRPFFPALHGMLIDFLRSLEAADWERQTVPRLWKVKDVTAHLLDVTLRRVSVYRDAWHPAADRSIETYDDLVVLLNELNGDWVKSAKRISPQLLIELLDFSQQKLYAEFNRLDMQAPAVFAVSWAGQEQSPNWFDVAREFTEHWLHQQQIRHACGNDVLLRDKTYKIFLDVFMQAWPHTMRNEAAEPGTIVKATVTGVEDGTWWLERRASDWLLTDAPRAEPVAETVIGGDIAWIVFSKSRRATDFSGSYDIRGDERLGRKWLDMVSVMA